MNTEELLQDFQRVSKLLQGREFSYHPNQAINKGIVGSKEEFDTIVNNLIQSGELIKMGSRQVEWNGRTINKNYYRIPDYTLPQVHQQPEPVKDTPWVPNVLENGHLLVKPKTDGTFYTLPKFEPIVCPVNGTVTIPLLNFEYELKWFSDAFFYEVAMCSTGTGKDLVEFAKMLANTPLKCDPVWTNIGDIYNQNPNLPLLADTTCKEDWYLRWFLYKHFSPIPMNSEPAPDTEIPF